MTDEFLERIRRIAITGVVRDDAMQQRLVLKGGNALRLVHQIGSRASIDLDFSMEKDFDDEGKDVGKILKGLENGFDAADFVVFDFKCAVKPRVPGKDPEWGGYEIKFKLQEREVHQKHQGDPRRAVEVGGAGKGRAFKIDVSKYELTSHAREYDVDGFSVRTYTPEAILAEKLRALAQQLDEYPKKKRKARSRDLCDIYAISSERDIDVSSSGFRDLVRECFERKQVPLALLPKIEGDREFHRIDWAAVEQSVSGSLKSYDFHFDFLIELIEKLEALWNK